MRILIVDDEHTFGALLGRAVKKLGHSPVIATHPDDALAAFIDREIDAVITDIEMPGMSGVTMAAAMRAEDPDLPIAFCSATADAGLLARAATLGDLLPKVWTIAALRDLLASMEKARPRELARGSQTGLMARLPTGAPATTAVVASSASASGRRRNCKIKVICRTWERVARLCDQCAAGKTTLTLRGAHPLRLHEPVTIALSLPDELVLSIGGAVGGVQPGDGGGESVFAIHLTGMTPEMMAMIRSLIAAGRDGDTNHFAHARAVPLVPPPLPPRPFDFDRGDTESDLPMEEPGAVGLTTAGHRRGRRG